MIKCEECNTHKTKIAISPFKTKKSFVYCYNCDTYTYFDYPSYLPEEQAERYLDAKV